MNIKIITSLLFLITYSVNTVTAQCADAANIFAFVYNNKTYELVKENKTWVDAAACAVSRGGYLAEINSQEEQDSIFYQLKNKAGIDINKTVANDGGGASYVWLGGNDLTEEGKWILDGNNDGKGPQFWQGATDGSVVGGLYNNWGTEPDNWNDYQDALAIALTQWPVSSGSLGQPGEWNDLNPDDSLYFLIEYNDILKVETNEKKR